MRCKNHVSGRATHRGMRVGSCEKCGVVRLGDSVGSSDTWDAISMLFGDYELIGRVDTIRAPAGEVLAYRSRCPADIAALGVTPPHHWFKVNEHLWMCHDGEFLLLAHRSPSASRMVGA